MITLSTNIEAGEITAKATTQYSNYEFNSFCEFEDGSILGAGENGLMELTGSDDNGTEITGYFAPIMSNFGDNRPKRLRFLYFLYESDDDLTITVYADEQTGRSYTLPATKTGQQRVRIAIGRNGSGAYWTIKTTNTNGCDYSIDMIDGALITRSHGIVKG